MSKTIEDNGWTAVPRSLEKLLANRKNPKSKATPLRVEDMPLPNSAVVDLTLKHARDHLPKQTFSHSMRVYYYGTFMNHNNITQRCQGVTQHDNH